MAEEKGSAKRGGKFEIGEAVRFGWRAMIKNFWFLAAILLISMVLSGGSNYSTDRGDGIDGSMLALASIVGIAIWVLSTIIQMGATMIYVKLARGEKVEFNELFAHYRQFWSYFGASILYGLIVTGGLILLIVPGIIWAIKFGMYSYLVVDKKMGALEALRESSRVTMGEKWPLFLFGLLSVLIAIAGFLALGIGTFFAIPTIYIASAYIYLKLSDQKTA